MDYDDVKYFAMKDQFLANFRRMVPSQDACQEMKDAFENALEDFYHE